MAASSFAKGKGNGYMTPNGRPFGGSAVMEIGATRQSVDPFVPPLSESRLRGDRLRFDYVRRRV